MSKTNLTMREMFELENGKAPAMQKTALDTSKTAMELREQLTKKWRLIQWGAVRDVLFDKAVEMLDIPLLTFLLPAWKKYRDIMEFADSQKYPPNETELVSLAEHTIKVEHHPYLQVTYRGAEIPRARLEFTLKADLILHGIILRIQGGKIIAIQGGALSGSGELLLETESIIKKQFGSYELPGRVDLKDGILLREAPETRATAGGT